MQPLFCLFFAEGPFFSFLFDVGRPFRCFFPQKKGPLGEERPRGARSLFFTQQRSGSRSPRLVLEDGRKGILLRIRQVDRKLVGLRKVTRKHKGRNGMIRIEVDLYEGLRLLRGAPLDAEIHRIGWLRSQFTRDFFACIKIDVRH